MVCIDFCSTGVVYCEEHKRPLLPVSRRVARYDCPRSALYTLLRMIYQIYQVPAAWYYSNVGQIDQIDHDLLTDHLDRNVLLWYVMQDRYRADPTQEACPSKCPTRSIRYQVPGTIETSDR